MITGLSNFLFFNDPNTDSKLEKRMNLLFLDSDMRSRAMLIAWFGLLGFMAYQPL